VILALAPVSATGIATAVATVCTAVGGVIVSITVLIPLLRRTNEVHTMVNQQRTDSHNYIRALVRELRTHNIDVPVDQSLDDVPDPPPPNKAT
jgi:hypothetical protein